MFEKWTNPRPLNNLEKLWKECEKKYGVQDAEDMNAWTHVWDKANGFEISELFQKKCKIIMVSGMVPSLDRFNHIKKFYAETDTTARGINIIDDWAPVSLRFETKPGPDGSQWFCYKNNLSDSVKKLCDGVYIGKLFFRRKFIGFFIMVEV